MSKKCVWMSFPNGGIALMLLMFWLDLVVKKKGWLWAKATFVYTQFIKVLNDLFCDQNFVLKGHLLTEYLNIHIGPVILCKNTTMQ